MHNYSGWQQSLLEPRGACAGRDACRVAYPIELAAASSSSWYISQVAFFCITALCITTAPLSFRQTPRTISTWTST
eukprot:682114-Pleurochrysis_carterae.AAC.3